MLDAAGNPDSAGVGLASAHADSASAHSVARSDAAAVSTVNAAFVSQALRRMDSNDLLRIEGDFGRFHGYASTLGTAGLRGLRAEPSLTSTAGVSSLTWEHIYRIDKRGSSAASGAVHGAVIAGLSAGLLTFGVIEVLLSFEGDAGAGDVVFYSFAGAGVGAAVGGLIGGAVGAAVPRWHRVYER